MASHSGGTDTKRIEGGQDRPPLVSVIIPTHNSEAYLVECLESVLNQTLPDWELIVVDDCSTDSSIKITREYAQADQRIRIIALEEHGGPAVARNRGIDEARGTYLYFLDSDDFCDTSVLEKSVACLEKTGGDLCAFPFYRLDMRVNEPWRAWWCLPPETMFEGTRTWRDYAEDFFGVYQNFAWNKVMRRSLVEQHSIRFQEGIHLTEDLMFTAVALVRSQGIAVIDEPLVTHREGTSTNVMSNKDAHPLDFITAFSTFKDFLETEGFMDGLRPAYLYWVTNACFYNVNTLSSSEAYLEAFGSLAHGAAEALGLFGGDLPEFMDVRYNWLVEALAQDDPIGYLFRIYRNADDELAARDIQLATTRMNLERVIAERDAVQANLQAVQADFDEKMNATEQRIGQAVCKVPRFVQRKLSERKR